MRRDEGSTPALRHYQNRVTARETQAVRRVTEDEIADDLTVADPEEDEDEGWYPRMPKSALRLRDTRDDPRDTPTNQRVTRQGPRTVVITTQHRVPARASTVREQQTEELPRPRLRLHWLVFVGLALFIMGFGYVLVSVIGNWWTTTQQQ